jgi:sarcosine oxidase subunit gamma
MPDVLPHSPTTSLAAIAGAGVTAVEAPLWSKLVLRLDGEARRRTEDALHIAVPGRPLTSAEAQIGVCLWLGPDEWLLVTAVDTAGEVAARLAAALVGTHHAVVDVSHRTLAFRLAGPRVRDALAAGCPLDLHPPAFPSGAVARTLLGKVGITLHLRRDGTTFDLYVDRSFAEYAWRHLELAARELNG